MAIKVMVFLKKREDLSDEEFRRYYEDSHAKLVRSIFPQIGRYARHYVVAGSVAAPIRRVAGVEGRPWLDIDVITELHFDDDAAFARFSEVASDPAVIAEVMADEANLFDFTMMQICRVETAEGPPN